MTNANSSETAPSRGLFSNATLLLTFATIFWGGNAVAGKLAVGEVSPLLLTAIRWMIASLILLVLAHRHLARDWPIIRQRLLYLSLLGVFGFAIFNAALYTSLKYTTAINVTIFQAAMPMMIFVMNFTVFRTRIHWAQAVGYAVTLIGVLLTASGGDMSLLADLELNRGDVMILIGAFIYSSYSVALRSRPDIHWLSFFAVLVCAAAVTSALVAVTEVANGSIIWPRSATAWGVIVYTVIFPSMISQTFFARGVELIGSNRAGLFMNLVPIFGSALAVLLLGETFQLYHGLAMALVIGGIAIAQNLTPRSE